MNRTKFITAIAISFLVGLTTYGQAPEQFKYQSIARDAGGQALANAPVGLQISIHDQTPTGLTVFEETHAVTTNDFGLFTISIGAGTNLIGSIGSVDWGNGPKYIEVQADLTGGTAYAPFGTTQLLSVPYALYANTANTSGTPILPNGTAIGNTTYWDGLNWVVNSDNIYNAGGFVGFGTNTPLQKVDVSGSVNIHLDSAYMIDNRNMLWAPGTANLHVGDSAGLGITFGNYNTFAGFKAGTLNSVGSQNTFLGAETGINNLDGVMNTFIGRRAGLNNISGAENVFAGAYAGQNNVNGEHNCFFGVTSGNNNQDGEENSFLGAHAGYFNQNGSFNTFVGNFSGLTNVDGNFNTLLGFQSDFGSANLTNASAFGYGAIVNASNSIVVGNTAVTSIGGQVGWSTLSDKRLKKKIKPNQLGLAFINSLETVNYEYKAEGQEGIRYSGLLAQDVEKVLQGIDMEFSGLVRPKNENDHYSLRYSEFVIPLIKAVQEQSDEIDELKARNNDLEKRLEALEKKVNNK